MEVDYSIPDGLPSELVARLLELRQELEEGDITAKGYKKHREQILALWTLTDSRSERSVGTSSLTGGGRHFRHPSGYESLTSVGEVYQYPQTPIVEQEPRSSVDIPEGPLQTPLVPRGIPETANTDPLNVKFRLNNFDNLPSILRHRGQTNAEIMAFQMLDHKGRESNSITWAKLAARAEKAASMLREQSGLFRGDRVCLLYAEGEPINFTTALMGCFLAGMVAVPIPAEQLSSLQEILETAQCSLILTSEVVLKHVTKQYPDLLKLGQWWKTTDWGSYPSKRGLPALQVPDLAYIEFTRSANGELRGVVMSHRTILHQMQCMTAILQSRSPPKKRVDRLLCSLDIRRSTGLILGVLLAVYAGSCTYFLSPSSMSTPGLYANLASRLQITILLADLPSLKSVCYNYQSAPQATRQFSKKYSPNLRTVRWCLVDSAVVDTEFQLILADRWFRPLGNSEGRSVIAPMLTLQEHGGMVVAMRDELTPDAKNDGQIHDVHISKNALSHNVLEVVAQPSQDTLAVGYFGYPIPDATIAIVDPDTQVLSGQNIIGEIWIDSPSLSGGFWGLKEETGVNFHAQCLDAQDVLPLEFLRTGLLGFILDGSIYILGTLSDRLVQKDQGQVSWYYSPHLVEGIMRSVPRIYDGCIFQIPGELSVVLIETPIAKPPVVTPGSRVQRDDKTRMALEDACSQVLAALQTYNFKVYAIVATWPRAFPRSRRSGQADIAKLIARRAFLRGELPAVHIKFDELPATPIGEDPQGGIWSPAISFLRTKQLGPDAEQQFSGIDMRKVGSVVDDRTSAPLDTFESIPHILQWRLSRQADELAYLSVAVRPQEQKKETSWRQFDMRVTATYNYIKDHLYGKEGFVALLMYTHSEEFVVAVHACFLLGITVIPISPINLDRVEEDLGTLIKIVRIYKVDLILGNHETYSMMEEKVVASYLRRQGASLPKLHNTAKVKVDRALCRTFKIPARALKPEFPALVWLYFNGDHNFTASQISHASLLGMCKIQKETCQMTSNKPIIGCVRSVSGLGFLWTCCLGMFVGSSTLLVSPFDYANNPASFFVTASRYKVKDGYGTQQMLQHACRMSKPQGFDLSELQNIVVPYPSRANTEIVSNMRLVFSQTGLESSAVNVAYGPLCNPMATTRSYMLVDPIDLWLDPVALRSGFVSIVNPANCANALQLQDSGMVPINTQIAIVNPETHCLCRAGEFGEIWVLSDGNQHSEFAPKRSTAAALRDMRMRLFGVIADGDPKVQYLRTGDLGFLHSVTKGGELEMQVLFVLGPLRNTVEIGGLQYFATDIENTVCEVHIRIEDAIIVRCDDISSVIVETTAPRNTLCSLSAVVAGAILDIHQVAINVVVFVAKGKILRSRLQEKQRQRTLAAYLNGSLEITDHFTVLPVNRH